MWSASDSLALQRILGDDPGGGGMVQLAPCWVLVSGPENEEERAIAEALKEHIGPRPNGWLQAQAGGAVSETPTAGRRCCEGVLSRVWGTMIRPDAVYLCPSCGSRYKIEYRVRGRL